MLVQFLGWGKNLERKLSEELKLWEELSDTETANGTQCLSRPLSQHTDVRRMILKKVESTVPGQEAILRQSLRTEAKGHRRMELADLFQITDCYFSKQLGAGGNTRWSAQTERYRWSDKPTGQLRSKELTGIEDLRN